MAKRKRRLVIVLVTACIVVAALAVWIVVNIRNGNFTYTDHVVDIEIIPPATS